MWLTRIHRTDLNLLTVFYAVYSERNITKAGEVLYLTQSGVSHALRRLRVMFDDELFVRTARGVKPTRRADELAPQIRQVLEGCLALVAPHREAFDPAAASVTFRIAMSDYEDYLIAPKLATALQGASGQLAVRIQDLRPAAALAALEAGDLDLVVGPFPHIPNDFQRRALFSDRLVVIARRDHPEIGDALSLEEFVRCRHLRVQFHDEGETLAERVLSQSGLLVRYAMTSTHFLVAPRIVAQSDLLAVVRRLTLPPQGELPVAEFPMPVPTRPFAIWAVWHRRSDGHPATACLVDLLATIGAGIQDEPG